MKKFNPVQLFFILLFLDQFSKFVALKNNIAILNSGVSLGLFEGFAQEIYVQLMLLFALIYTLSELKTNKWVNSILLSGVISNTIDRLFHKSVIDWIPVPFINLNNNLADWYIFFAMITFVLITLYENRNNLRR